MLCAQGPAPRAATIARYRGELGLELVPGTGPLAAVVPGAFGGWMAMLRDYGTLPLRDVAAVRDRLRGGRLSAAAADRGRDPQRRVAVPRRVDDVRRVYLPAPEPGALQRNPALAATYRAIVLEPSRDGDDRGRARRWYRGFVAEAMVRFQEHEWMDSSGERHAGLLAEDDLCDWQPTYEQPLAIDYHGLTVLKAGPWSQAPVFLQQLRLLEGFDLEAMGHVGAEYVHTVTECAKLAFADREAWYGDPDFVDVPLDASALPRLRGRAARARDGRTRRPSSGPASPAAARRGCRRAVATMPRRHPVSASRRAATPSISTSPTAGATSSLRRRAGAGCGARR